MDNKPTEKQQRILDALSSFIKKNGYTPSQRELARNVGLKSPNTIDYHLKKLEELGFVKCVKNRFRSLEVLGARIGRGESIPLLGTVPAGAFNYALLHEEYIEVDPSLIKGRSLALRVKGDSMKDAGIIEGDVVVVRLQQTAENGDIVVARDGEDATVKYFRQIQGQPFLYPANPRYGPIAADRLEIVGKVTGVVRRY